MRRTNDISPLTPRQRLLLDALYREHAGIVRTFVLARSSDPELADDITAVVFLEAARAIGGGRQDQLSIGWLITVARRRMIDGFRRSRSEERFASAVSSRDQADCADDVLARLLVVDLLGEVQPRQRAVLWHRYLADQPVARIAERFGLSESAAESLLRRGRRSLLRIVAPDRGGSIALA